jgi:hypothetical protein
MFKAKSKRNEEYAEFLGKQGKVQLEWIVTIYFYSALHLLKGFLITKLNKNFSDIETHKDIYNYLLDAERRNLITSEVKRSYCKLYWASKTARYQYSPFSKCSVNEIRKFDEQAYQGKARRLLSKDYPAVKNFLTPLL